MAANLDKIVEELSVLTVLEAAELSNMLEEKWGVTAAVAAAPAAAVAAGPAAEEKMDDDGRRHPEKARRDERMKEREAGHHRLLGPVSAARKASQLVRSLTGGSSVRASR